MDGLLPRHHLAAAASLARAHMEALPDQVNQARDLTLRLLAMMVDGLPLSLMTGLVLLVPPAAAASQGRDLLEDHGVAAASPARLVQASQERVLEEDLGVMMPDHGVTHGQAMEV